MWKRCTYLTFLSLVRAHDHLCQPTETIRERRAHAQQWLGAVTSPIGSHIPAVPCAPFSFLRLPLAETRELDHVTGREQAGNIWVCTSFLHRLVSIVGNGWGTLRLVRFRLKFHFKNWTLPGVSDSCSPIAHNSSDLGASGLNHRVQRGTRKWSDLQCFECSWVAGGFYSLLQRLGSWRDEYFFSSLQGAL